MLELFPKQKYKKDYQAAFSFYKLRILFVINLKQMIFNRPKQSKSQTPTRYMPLSKITPILGASKKSDPFLKQLKEVYDKQNIHPNLKVNRTKSYLSKPDNPSQNHSPVKKIMNIKHPIKNVSNVAPSLNKLPNEHQSLGSHSKYNKSSELQKIAYKSKGSNRKSTQKDQPQIIHFQDQYYTFKEEKKEKKMKVTLKDLKKQRKSIIDSDGEYLAKTNGQTRQSISQDSLGKMGTIKIQFLKNQKSFKQATQPKNDEQPNSQLQNQDYICSKHPDKVATHTLVDSTSGGEENYCSKCAVDLATKGFQISPLYNHRQDIRKLDIREERISQLKNFLFELDKMEPLYKRTTRRIESYKQFLSSKFEEQNQKLDTYYNNLAAVINSSYISSAGSLKLHHDAILEQIDTSLAFLSQQISTLKDDIIPNINSIIEQTQIQEESFKIVIENHYKKLQQIQHFIMTISGENYCFYHYRLESIEHLLLELRNIITPDLERQYFDGSFQTERKNNQHSDEKWFDPFRMSFGKNSNSAFRL